MFRYAAAAETSEITQSVNTLNSRLQNSLLVHGLPENTTAPENTGEAVEAAAAETLWTKHSVQN